MSSWGNKGEQTELMEQHYKHAVSEHSQTFLENTEGKSSFLRADAHSCKSLPSGTPRVLQLFAGRTTVCSCLSETNYFYHSNEGGFEPVTEG